MKQVTFLVGLPGSGKTHYLEAHAGIFKGYIVIDDASVGYNREAILDTVKRHPNIVVADPFLCKAAFRDGAKKLFQDFKQTWVFFENNPSSCYNNVCYRNDGRNVSRAFIDVLSRDYNIPDGATIIPVFSRED